jgi:hypothetical protein
LSDVFTARNNRNGAFLAIDQDRSVRKLLAVRRPDVFVNGVSRHVGEITESTISRKHGIELADGLGTKVRRSWDLMGLSEKQ